MSSIPCQPHHQLLYSVISLTYEESTSEPQTSMTDQTSLLPFTFIFKDVHIKTTRAGRVHGIESQRFSTKEAAFTINSISSYETLKPCIIEVLLNSEISIYREACEFLKENIAILVCDEFREIQMIKQKTKGFIVLIELQKFQECEEEDEDRVIRELIEATMNMGPRTVPASKESIEQLDSRKFEEEKGEACIVCLEEFSAGLEVKVMPCGHAFHGECIIKWLQNSHLCPLCRFAMPVDAD